MNNYFYSEHQQYLYDTSKKLYGEGLGYRKISNWFNERNIKTPRGNEFKGNYVFSILKKGKIREERLNRESDWKIKKNRDYFLLVLWYEKITIYTITHYTIHWIWTINDN